MQVLKSFKELKSFQVSAVTLGNFDGFHLGHKHLVSELNRHRTLMGGSLLITFDPHPREVLTPGLKVPRLTLWSELRDKFEAASVDLVLRLKFDEGMKSTSADDFMGLLQSSVPFETLVIGHDFALGANREGGADFLKNWCAERKIGFVQVPPFERNGEIVSSQKIRDLLRRGNLEEANLDLGEPYRVVGRVKKGDGRGRTLQFPTANLFLSDQKIIPALGVYGGRALLDGRSYPAVCNIGRRPTFKDQDEVNFEVHILDFQEDIYGVDLDFEFLFRVREEKKFSSKEELIAQINKDVDVVKARVKV